MTAPEPSSSARASPPNAASARLISSLLSPGRAIRFSLLPTNQASASPLPVYRSSSALSNCSIRSCSFSSMSPSLNSSGLLDRSKSWPTSSMSCLLARTNSQPSLMCICSKAQVVSAMMCQGSSIPHSWRKSEYSRAALRVRSPYSLTKIPLPSTSSSDMCFWLLSPKGHGHHVQRGCAPEESLLIFQHVIINVTAYTILPSSLHSTQVQVVVAELHQYVGSVPEVDDTGLVVGERNTELLIVVLCDARFPFIQLRRNLLLFVHLDQHFPRLLYRLYLGQILHR